MSDDSDDDRTPATRAPAYSATALNLLDVALSLNGVALNLREAARVLDQHEEGARRSLEVELEFQLAEVGRLCLEASAALKQGA